MARCVQGAASPSFSCTSRSSAPASSIWVPKRQFNEIEAKRSCSGACGRGDGASAPFNVGEQAGIGELHPQEVVTSVVARSEHHPSLATRGNKNRGSQWRGSRLGVLGCRNSTRRRRCGPPQTTAGRASDEEHSDQTLRRPKGLPWSRPPERRRFPTPDVGPGISRRRMRIGGIAGNWGGQRCRGNILGCIPEECSAQPGSLLRAERRAKTRFGLPRAGGFRHDADR